MKLGIMMALGSSLEDQAKSGQDSRFITYYLEPYTKHFEEVKLFSYANESRPLSKGIRIIPNRKRQHRALYALLMPFAQARELRECDILRVMQMTGALPAALTRILYRVPFVATFGYGYSDLARLNGKKLTATFTSLLEWIGIRFADRIIVTNPVIKEYLLTKRGVPERKIVTIPNGVDCDRFTPAQKAVGKEVRILSVGRLEEEKNYAALIEAIADLQNPAVSLTILGRGSLESSLQALAKEKGVSLQILSTIPYSQIAEVYQAATIFVLPSLSEGQPKVLLEAMSCALPCVISPCAGNLAVVEKEEGFIAKDYSAQALAAALRDAIEQPKQAKARGEKAREKILRTYNLKQNVAQEIELLTATARKSSSIS